MIKRIVKEIERMSGRYSGYEVFSDWVQASAIAISNYTDMFHDPVWKKREEEYMNIAEKHGRESMKKFSEMVGMLLIALEDNMKDVLGRIYMEAGLGSKHTGQFFTPFHISKLIADIEIGSRHFDGDEKIEIDEPSCGGGGMIIAAAKSLKEKGINYQKVLRVSAQDLDWKGVYMTYVQLSLLGNNAVVVQGDTLAEPYTGHGYPPEKVLYTPVRKGMLI